MSSYWLLSEWRVLQIVIANFCFIYRQSPLSSFPYDIYMYNAIIGLVSILISQSSWWFFLAFAVPTYKKLKGFIDRLSTQILYVCVCVYENLFRCYR